MLLLRFCGFDLESAFTADGHPDEIDRVFGNQERLVPLLEHRREDLGHYIFLRARKRRAPREGLPRFLFSAYDDSVLRDA